jgi:hypothetical protein
VKLRYQIDFNLARAEYLRIVWDDEIELYKKSLKKKELKTIEGIDPQLIDDLLKLYLQRCKFKHTLVFV